MAKRSQDSKKRSGDRQKVYAAEDVRQGRIVLRKTWQRWVFVAGLAGIVLMGLIFMLIMGLS